MGTKVLQLLAILRREPDTYHFWKVHLSSHRAFFLGFRAKKRPARRLALRNTQKKVVLCLQVFYNQAYKSTRGSLWDLSEAAPRGYLGG